MTGEEERINAANKEGRQDEVVEEATTRKTEKLEKVTRKLQSTYALPQASSKILSDILKAYVIASNQGAEAVTYKDVAVVANLHPTQVSRNNAFLAQSGFISTERYGYYRPAVEVTEFAKESPWDEDGSKRHIRQLIDKTWYGEVILQKFQMRSVLPKEELVKAFGIKATPDQSEANRLDYLLDFLEYSDYIQKDEQGNYVPNHQEPTDATVIEPKVWIRDATEIPTSNASRPSLPGADPEMVTASFRNTPQVNLNITLTASTTDEELREIAERVRSLLRMLDEGE